MEKHFTLDDTTFKQQFAHAELPAELFTHEAHLRLAWIHLTQSGLESSLVNVPNEIKAYVTALGAMDKYNHTLTIAAIRAVYHFLLKSNARNFQAFINEFPALKLRFKGLLAQHYSFDLFKSQDAKKAYLEPDLLAFD